LEAGRPHGYHIAMGCSENDNLRAREKPEQRARAPRPDWLKVRLPAGERYARLRRLIRQQHLHTVCESARCPNIGECWGAGTATFMILGDVCTRACKFCAVKTGLPPAYDLDEPRRIAAAIRRMNLDYAVVTSVDRDDLADGGAFIFAETIRLTRESSQAITIEVLIPDLRGDAQALGRIVDARPDVLAHNVETVPRLYPVVRAGSRYRRSLQLLGAVKAFHAAMPTKSSIMLGLGEQADEVLDAMRDLRGVGVDILTLGQYLQPTREHLPVARYYSPDEFRDLREAALACGFSYVESGPLVRSSYRANQQKAILPGHASKSGIGKSEI
jgi:lipoic acid synthetase